MSSDATWALIVAERRDLVELCESLTDAQWDAPSLCGEWRVRDVVGHVICGAHDTLWTLASGAVKYRGLGNHVLARQAVDVGQRPPDALLARLRAIVESRHRPPFIAPSVLLADFVVHTQDIRRPLGLERQVPEDRLRAALDQIARQRLLVGSKARAARLRLVANDLDWNHGQGPEVRGAGEALLMAMAGRKLAKDELEGSGAAALLSR